MKQINRIKLGLAVCTILLTGCTGIIAPKEVSTVQKKGATEFTAMANAKVYEELDFTNTADYKAVSRGFIATWPDDQILDANGNVVWDFKQWDFLGEPNEKIAPDTVNPSLWRQSQLNRKHGLFEVVPGIYQVRGFDLSQMTFIRGEKGWIVMDPCVTVEVAKASYKLVKDHLEDLPITGVIVTHSHVDHFGGIKGVVTKEDLEKGKVVFIAPEHFFEESVSENLMAGNAMSRRATYMYGNLIPKNEQGSVGGGLGQTTSIGEITILEPTHKVIEDGQVITVDGLDLTFLEANGTEAPAELVYYIEKYKALCPAEVVNHTLHNLSTLRGAQTRDALKWSKVIDKMLKTYGEKAEIMFAPHHWPTWGNEEIVQHLEGQRDAYKFIHDQALRLANQGYGPIEIAEKIKLPAKIGNEFYNRGYYGTVNHGSKAVYDKYFGAWWNGRPSNLYKLPTVEAATRYVEYMGGEDKVLKMAKKSFDNGDYRWVVEVLNHVVYANPENKQARYLEADAMEQLGYQSESGTWRAYFLTGAQELRNGVVVAPAPNTASKDMVEALPMTNLMDYLAVLINSEKATDLDLIINVKLTDVNENYSMTLKNSVLNSYEGLNKSANTTLKIKRETLNKIILGETTLTEEIKLGSANVENLEGLNSFLGSLEKPDFWFNLVEPIKSK